MTTQTTIWCTFQVEGWHSWPEAPQPYLRNNHRHLFHFKVEVSVNDLNREIEFIDFGRELKLHEERVLVNTLTETLSCEQIAHRLIQYIVSVMYLKSSLIRVTVSEDGENGATVTYEEEKEI